MNTPNIRFKGFTGDWEKKKLGDLFSERAERANGDEELLSVTINNGVMRQADSDKKNTASDNKSNYKIVKKGDVPYNSMRMWQGAVGTSEYDGIVSPAYTVITPKENANGKFFVEMFKKNSTLEIFKRWSQGLTSDTWNLKFPTLSTIVFHVPSVEEQTKIAHQFTIIDNLITLHQRKCDSLKQVKKYMLQKMFPKQGEKVPEIRFAGFTGDWELRKLGDVAEIIGGGTPSTNNPEYWDGDIDWYAPAEINEQVYVDSSERKITKLGLEQSSAKLLPANKTVLFTSRAGIGKTAILRHSAATNQGFQSMVLNENTNTYFVYSMTDMIKNKAEKVASGSTFAEISGKMLGNIEFMFPSKLEQDKIGSYFEKIDSLITLHQRKSDSLKEIKKFMLQNMFPQK